MSKINNINNVLRNKSNFQIFINALLILLAICGGAIKAQTPLLPDTTFVCNADSVELDAGPGFVSYFWWETNEQAQTIWVKETGLYHVNCDTAESQPPILDSTWVFFQNAEIVQGDSVITNIYPVTLCVAPDTSQFTWTSNDPDYIIEFDTAACIDVTPNLDPTVFYVSITDSLDILTCIDSVTIMRLIARLPDTTIVCHTDSVFLDAGPGFINYQWWETGEQTQTIWAMDTGWYHVTCDAPELQEPIIDSTWVFFQNTAIVQGDSVITNIYPVTLCVSPDTLQYVWTSSDPDYFIEFDTAACIDITPDLDPTVFYVSTTDSLNILTCTDSVTIMRLITRLPDTTLACHADSVQLDAGPGFLNYFWWETGESSQTIWAHDTGLYHVTCDTLEFQGVMDSTWVYFQKAGIVQNDTLTCYNYSLELCVEPDTLKYFWTSSDTDYVIEHDTAACIEVIPELDTTTFYVSITDSLNILTCIDSVTVWLHPRMRFEEVTQINTGCPESCKGQLEVIVSGGKPPYSYLWFTAPEQYDSIAFGLCEQDYTFRVFDEFICIRDTVLPVEVYDIPEIEIIRDPTDAIYIQNPVVTFSFDNLSIDSIQIIDWNWNFGDSTYSIEEMPVKVFENIRDYDVWLKYTTSDECIDSVMMNVNVEEAILIIPNIFTPNSDGANDTFKIKDLEFYMSNEIAIFNRYGKKVFSQNNYQSDWDGGNLRDGAYFYVLKAKGYFGTNTYRGSITILRGY
ncbi:MAG: hypothetical protein B6D64_00255 [Bacteroidetes bacterium 4484_276]|nr:MAG: hypothetical protein B6D64_00255 [Bacteroidetes bacterium 4484_276]